jgi:putative oxidoreductase
MLVRRVARPLLGAIFVWGGINALRTLDYHAQVAKPVVDKAPVDMEPNAAVRADALVKIGAGVALGAGVLPRLAALLLAGDLVPTTLAGHRFWESDSPQERTQQQIHFMKNVGLIGGLLLASADTGGKPSVGWRARRAADRAGKRAKDLVTRG